MAELVNIFAPDIRKKIKKEVPTVEGAWAMFYDDLLMEDMQDIANKGGEEMSEEEKGNKGYKFVVDMMLS